MHETYTTLPKVHTVRHRMNRINRRSQGKLIQRKNQSRQTTPTRLSTQAFSRRNPQDRLWLRNIYKNLVIINRCNLRGLQPGADRSAGRSSMFCGSRLRRHTDYEQQLRNYQNTTLEALARW